MSPEQVRNAFDDLGRKNRTTHYLRSPPLDMVPLGKPVLESG
jgi:hypothetical protein